MPNNTELHAQPEFHPNKNIAIESRLFEGSEGLKLAADCFGSPDNPPVILSHGGGQTRHSWKGTAESLAAQGWYAIAYDHRGHGDSDWSASGEYALTAYSADQTALVRSLSKKPVLIGASLGGLSGITTEGSSPESLLKALILVDITPRISHQGASNIVNFMAAKAEEGFASLDEAAEVIAKYTHRPKRKDNSGLSKNLRLGEDKRYRWHWDPKLLRGGLEEPNDGDQLEAYMDRISVPTLLVRGRMSDLVTEEIADGFIKRYPNAEYVDVENARHMVAGDKNDIFTEAVLDFMSRL